MKFAIEVLSPVERRVQVEIPTERVNSLLKEITHLLSQQVRLKGFRKGKIPSNVLEQLPQYRNVIQDEAQNRFREAAFKELLENHKEIEPLALAASDIGPVAKGKPFAFSFTLEIRPDLDLLALEGRDFSLEQVEIQDNDIDEEIERLRKRHASLRDVEGRGAKDGDRVKLDLVRTPPGQEPHESKDVSVWLGKGPFPKAFDEALFGAAPGDTRVFSIDHPENVERDAGHYSVTIKALQEQILPDIDDGFAQDQGHSNLAEMREKLRKQLQESENKRCIQRAHQRMLNSFAETLQIPVPETFLNNYIDQRLNSMLAQFNFPSPGGRIDKLFEGMRQTMRPDALQEIQRSFLVGQAIKAYQITVSKEDIDAEFERLAEEQGRTASFLKSKATAEEREQIERDISRRKAIDVLWSRCRTQIESLTRSALEDRIDQEFKDKNPKRDTDEA